MGMEYKAGAEPHAALVRHESWLWLALLGSVSILAAGKSFRSPRSLRFENHLILPDRNPCSPGNREISSLASAGDRIAAQP
jgi:hypothetical protein